MAFATGYLDDPSKVGAGERWGNNNIILSYPTFQNGLVVGRFAKLDTGSLDNLDNSATPTIAGVVLRNVASPVEDGGTIDSALYDKAEAVRSGLVTVRVKTGETPAQFGTVYAENTDDANAGMALAAAGANGVEVTGAEFIEEVQAGVWLVRLS